MTSLIEWERMEKDKCLYMDTSSRKHDKDTMSGEGLPKESI